MTTPDTMTPVMREAVAAERRARVLAVRDRLTGEQRDELTRVSAWLDHLAADLAAAIARAERAEAALRDDVAAQYRAAFAADAAARARLADERAAIPPTERDRRGVPLGTGAGVGGGAL